MLESMLMVAGEASADLHGAKVLQALWSHRPHLHIFGVGGAAMRALGFDAVIPAEALSIGGLTEVFTALPRVWGYLRTLKRLAQHKRPQAALLLDLPDFNLRLARLLKALNIPVIYYIGPQVWAWRAQRIKLIRAWVDHMLVILPFEQAFYQQHGMSVQFVGHPLIEYLPASVDKAAARQGLGLASEPQRGPLIALLPGSRRQEILRHLPVMLESLDLLKASFPHLRAVVPVASTVERSLIDTILKAKPRKIPWPVTVVCEHATDALAAADASVICSGTATLQAALLKQPMVVVYRLSWLTHHILKRLIRVPYISLVNLIAGDALVPELIQQAFTSSNVARTLTQLLRDPSCNARLQTRFHALRSQLGDGRTSSHVAQVVMQYFPIHTGCTLKGSFHG